MIRLQWLWRYLFPLFALVVASSAFAASGGVEFVNFYKLLLQKFGFAEHDAHEYGVLPAALLGWAFIAAAGFYFRKSVLSDTSAAPSQSFSLRVMIESILDFVYDLSSDVIGKVEGPKYLTLLAGLFFFILFNNLSGLVPGFPPATESLSTNLALGVTVFLTYNYLGVKEHGMAYLKHFLGPVMWLAPLMLFIEIMSHLVRPVSLSLRLYGNIFGDHLVLSVFTGLTKVGLPSFLLFFGVLVACVQSLVFTLLSSIYISVAISHDH